jgi:hypothetical protein
MEAVEGRNDLFQFTIWVYNLSWLSKCDSCSHDINQSGSRERLLLAHYSAAPSFLFGSGSHQAYLMVLPHLGSFHQLLQSQSSLVGMHRTLSPRWSYIITRWQSALTITSWMAHFVNCNSRGSQTSPRLFFPIALVSWFWWSPFLSSTEDSLLTSGKIRKNVSQFLL